MKLVVSDAAVRRAICCSALRKNVTGARSGSTCRFLQEAPDEQI